MARPKKVTKDVVKKLEAGFSMGLSDKEACVYAGISKQTLYNYCEEHEEFLDRKELLKESVKMHAKINLFRQIKIKKDISMSQWYLERKCKDEFSPKQELEYTGNVNINNPFEGLSTEDLKKLADADDEEDG
jgi:hypothetical protein